MRAILLALCAVPAFAGTVQMPVSCTKPDGMAVDPKGRLVIAAPNNDRRQPGAIFRVDAPGGPAVKWLEVPAHPETGYAQPMGVCFGPEGELYVCDCNEKGRGRLLRITLENDRFASCETIAEGLDNANGVKCLNGRLYLTQAFLYGVKRADGAATSGLYMFAATDRNVRVRNRPDDPQCVFSDVTRNPSVTCGLNGVAVDSKGNVYVGNYGDGRVWKLTPGKDGRIVERVEFVSAAAGVKTPDGLCVDAGDNLYIADMRGDAAWKVTPAGAVSAVRIGGFNRPSEPCVWKGTLYVSDYGGTTLQTIALGDAAFGAKYRALWNDEIERGIAERIERHRKADFTAEGFPAGAEVRVRQETSAFQFGANMFLFGQLGSEKMNAAYRAAFTGLFNAATIPFYWQGFEPIRGVYRYLPSTEADSEKFWNAFDFDGDDPYFRIEYRRPSPSVLIDFCRKNGISAHGHALIYMAYVPKWLDDARWTRDDMEKLMTGHIRTIAALAKDSVDQWDVVNESTGRGPTCTEDHPDDAVSWFEMTHRVKCPMPPDYTFRSFKTAEAAFPFGVRLAINDAWPTNQCYPAFAKSLVDRGAKIDIVGLQRHIFKPAQLLAVAKGELDVLPSGTAWGPQTELRQLAALDRVGKPIHISEITVPSPRGLDGLSDVEADAIQARVLRDQYRLWFSWPSVYRITYWNLVDGTGAKNEQMSSGWFNRDMSRKRVWYAMNNLINHEWRTDVKVNADASGRIAFRGFKGRYRLSWMSSDGKPATRTVLLK